MILCISFLKVKFYYPATFVFLLVRRRESLAANRIETVSNHSRVKAKEERRRKRRRYECKSTRISTRHSQLRVRNLDETTLDFVYVRVSRTKKVEGGRRKVAGMANGKSLKERMGYVRTLARSRRKEKRTARLLLFSAGMDARLMEYKTET